tara:strand:- start:359 stop:601 length:243 start_codon:yes stop_codon:yes gene_type:complete
MKNNNEASREELIRYIEVLTKKNEALEEFIDKKYTKAINYTHSCKSDSEQLEAVEDLKEWAYDNCNSFTQERLNKIIERL